MTTGELKLNLETRTDSGSNSSRRLRKTGKIPTVIYGQGKEPKQCIVDANEWRVIAKLDTQILKASVDNNKALLNVLIREVQYNYLADLTMHIDLQEINMNEAITATVPINTVGTAAGASVGGLVDQIMHELEVTCLPADLPESFEVDVTEVEINQSLYVKDVVLPENVETTLDPEQVILHVAEPKVKLEAEEEGDEGTETEASVEEEKSE